MTWYEETGKRSRLLWTSLWMRPRSTCRRLVHVSGSIQMFIHGFTASNGFTLKIRKFSFEFRLVLISSWFNLIQRFYLALLLYALTILTLRPTTPPFVFSRYKRPDDKPLTSMHYARETTKDQHKTTPPVSTTFRFLCAFLTNAVNLESHIRGKNPVDI